MQKRKYCLLIAMSLIMVCTFAGCGGSATTEASATERITSEEPKEADVQKVTVEKAIATNMDTNSEEYLNNGLAKEEYYEKYGTVEGFITPAGTYREVELEKPVMLGYLKEPLEGAKEYVAKREDGKVGVSKDFDVYSLDKEKVGHYDEDCLVTIKSYNEEWCVIKCLRFEFLAKTEEVNEALTNAEVKLIEEEPAPSLAENNTSTENKTEEKSQADIEKEVALAYWENYVKIPLEEGKSIVDNGIHKKVDFRMPGINYWGDTPIYDTYGEDKQVIGTLKADGVVSLIEFVLSDSSFWGIEYNDSVAYVDFNSVGEYNGELNIPVTNWGDVYVVNNTTEAEPSTKEPEAIPNEPVVSEPTSEVVPETPVITEDPVVEEAKTESKPTPDEVLAFIHETLQGAGIKYYPDVYPDSSAGPSGGMGWSEGSEDPNWLMENIDQFLYIYQLYEYPYYYIEYLGEDENGEYIIRWYWG